MWWNKAVTIYTLLVCIACEVYCVYDIFWKDNPISFLMMLILILPIWGCILELRKGKAKDEKV